MWKRTFGAGALVMSVGCSASGDPMALDGRGAGGTAGTAGQPAVGLGGEAGAPPGGGGSLATGGASDGGGPGCIEAIDVVLVFDMSSSMLFAVQALQAEIASVVSASNALAPDAHFGLVVFVDNTRLDATGANGAVHLDASTLSAAFGYYTTTYMLADRNPGDPPNGPTKQNPICEENSLDALYSAAADFPWRANATRLAIVATDDTFLEAPDNYGDRDGDGKTDKTDFPKEGNYPANHTLSETVELLVSKQIRVFSFTRVKPPGFFDLACGTGRRLPASEVPAGWSKPYAGKPAIPFATDGQNFDLALVQAGQLSLAGTINAAITESRCNPPEPPR